MLYLKIKIMLFRIGTKAYFFDHNLLGFGLYFFLLLLLFVFKLRIVNHFTNRRICARRNLNQVQSLVLGELNSLLYGINIRFDVFSYHPDALSCNTLIYAIGLFWFLRSPPKGSIETSW